MDVLPDILAPGLDVVFCGTAVGHRSKQRRAYYAGPGNRFWTTLHEIGLTPVELAPNEYRRIVDYGLGLTDLAKQASGSDDDLSPSDFSVDVLTAKLKQFRPRILAFTSKNAAEAFFQTSVAFGPLESRIEDVEVFVLNSPSARAKKHWGKEQHWRDLANRVRRLRTDV